MTKADVKPPTLRDVARLAGVSVATASRALNSTGTGTHSETAELVARAARQLSYKPNAAARALATRGSDSIAMLVPEPALSLTIDPYLVRIFVALSTAAREHRKQVMLLMTGDAGAPDYIPDLLTGGLPAGVVVASHHGSALAGLLSSLTLPITFIGQPGVGGVSYVDVDNAHGAELATRHLAERGCRRIGTITGTLDSASGRGRFTGYLQATGALGQVPHYAHGDYTQRGGLEAARRLLAECPDLDGLFVASDAMALGAMEALAEAGRRVPDDLALVTFDNSPTSEERGWTSVDNPLGELASRALDLLLSPGGHSSHVIPARLVVRG